LEPIPEDKRLPEGELWAAFEADQPRILGALLDAVVAGLRRLPEIRLQKLPRMADFAIWATACETALRHQDGTFWKAGTFMDAYSGNIDEAVETVLSANPVATAVRAFMDIQATTTWTGTATDLLDLLGRIVGDKATKAKTWPADATRLGGKLRRAATFLRKVGIEISFGDREARTRRITITYFSKPQEVGSSASSASAMSSTNDSNGLAMTLASDADGQRHRDDTDADGRGAKDRDNDAGADTSVIANPLKINGDDTDDANDAESHTLTCSEKTGVPCLSAGRVRELADDYLGARHGA
jgi:hypothetical protein